MAESDLRAMYETPEKLKENYEALKAEILENESNGTNTKLVLTFAKANGDSLSQTYSNAKSNVSSANVKALMEGIIANGAIFTSVPAVMKSAKIVTTTETAVDLS